MPISDEINDRFLAGGRTDEIRFTLNDPVRIISGRHAKRVGSVISILTIEPEVTYLIEPGEPPWDNLQISQSRLELLASR